MSYITIGGNSYWSPCGDCKDNYCYSCVIGKYQNELADEKQKRQSAEFRIEQELEPRIKEEKRGYDLYVTTDRCAEWCDSFNCRVNELVDMFNENLDFSTFDFDGNDIVSKVGKLIYEYNKGK